ncbi:MAG: hypothetical protein JWR35_1049 [Marmoricola sp.]|nr:hypothetical protein [Marmoricola sp.]
MKSGSALRTTAVETRAVISKGQISLQAKDVEKTRFNLQRLLDGWNGTIASDESSADSKGRTVDERLVLRVPSASFGTAMTEIAKLGKLTDQSRTSEDVTTQVIDNSVRVRAQKLSLARIEALLAQAKNLNQIIAIEDQLSSRQADLDSLESQQKYLADQTTLSTITVYLSAHPKAVVHKEKKHGFVGGLDTGWTAFKDSAVAVLTAVGAVLPFAVLIGLIGVPVGLVLRRRRALPQTPPAEA